MRTSSIVFTPLLVLVASVPSTRADTVTIDEALTVAENWVSVIIHHEGGWGNSDIPTVGVREIVEFKRRERLLGYFCHVQPKGHIVVSLYRDLAPVKAYSETCDLDPDSEEGMVGFMKLDMERVLDEIESPMPPQISVQSQDVLALVESNHRPAWEILTCDIEAFTAGLEAGVIVMDYQGGDQCLLTSSWHQGAPYNQQCPPGDNCDRSLVGCVALAGAQIMRYWAWPPWGQGHHDDVYYDDGYDWANMPDAIDTNSSQAQINAVAELCREVGKATGTDYGCGNSTAWCGDKIGKDMADAYKDHFRYSENVSFDWRAGETQSSWWDKIKSNLNKNRPLQYCISDPRHSMVCDGWKAEGTTKLIHLKNWWNNTSEDTWYDVSNLPGLEGMIREIYPARSLESWLSEDPPDKHVFYVTRAFPYRYVDQDTCGRNVTFGAGHRLQFLPGVKLYATSPKGDYIRFEGTQSADTRLFSIKGTSTGGLVAGIKIYNGGIRLYPTGSLRFH